MTASRTFDTCLRDVQREVSERRAARIAANPLAWKQMLEDMESGAVEASDEPQWGNAEPYPYWKESSL